MKKLLFSLVLAFGLLGFTSNNIINPEVQITKKTTEVVECKWAQCSATAKSTKKRCLHCVSEEGDTYCWQHS
jgi:hypothetical protein